MTRNELAAQALLDKSDPNSCSVLEAEALVGMLKGVGKTPDGVASALMLGLAVWMHDHRPTDEGRRAVAVELGPTVVALIEEVKLHRPPGEGGGGTPELAGHA